MPLAHARTPGNLHAELVSTERVLIPRSVHPRAVGVEQVQSEDVPARGATIVEESFQEVGLDAPLCVSGFH